MDGMGICYNFFKDLLQHVKSHKSDLMWFIVSLCFFFFFFLGKNFSYCFLGHWLETMALVAFPIALPANLAAAYIVRLDSQISNKASHIFRFIKWTCSLPALGLKIVLSSKKPTLRYSKVLSPMGVLNLILCFSLKSYRFASRN